MATKTETNNGRNLGDKNTSDTDSNIETISLTSSEKGEGKYLVTIDINNQKICSKFPSNYDPKNSKFSWIFTLFVPNSCRIFRLNFENFAYLQRMMIRKLSFM